MNNFTNNSSKKVHKHSHYNVVNLKCFSGLKSALWGLAVHLGLKTPPRCTLMGYDTETAVSFSKLVADPNGNKKV